MVLQRSVELAALIRRVDYFRVQDHPGAIRPDNGPEFVAKDLRKRLAKVGTVTLYIEPESFGEKG